MTFENKKEKFNWLGFLWNAWCCLSIIGIWPRFIEHRLITTKQLKLKIPDLPEDLKGLKVVQFSDLHLHPQVSDTFLEKLKNKINACQPDILLFTGDFLCFSEEKDFKRLENFLNSFKPTYGCFAILGNHDYAQFVSMNEKGQYDVLNKSVAKLGNVFKRLWSKTELAYEVTEAARSVSYHESLEELLKRTPFTLLKNVTIQIAINDSFLNITGLEEYITGKFNTKKAFENYKKNGKGIILAHNPDAVPLLKSMPGDIILSGHTHGGQVNLPWLWKKFTLMEQPQFKSGLFKIDSKWLYVNRGVGSVMPFRWFAMPEVLFLQLQ
jgi:hypothetical protein